MPGLIKLVLIGLVLFAVWYVYNMQKRLRAAEKALHREKPAKPEVTVHDLKACPVCGQFVPTHGASACERPDCPFAR
jgi:hypothetical protein